MHYSLRLILFPCLVLASLTALLVEANQLDGRQLKGDGIAGSKTESKSTSKSMMSAKGTSAPTAIRPTQSPSTTPSSAPTTTAAPTAAAKSKKGMGSMMMMMSAKGKKGSKLQGVLRRKVLLETNSGNDADPSARKLPSLAAAEIMEMLAVHPESAETAPSPSKVTPKVTFTTAAMSKSTKGKSPKADAKKTTGRGPPTLPATPSPTTPPPSSSSPPSVITSPKSKKGSTKSEKSLLGKGPSKGLVTPNGLTTKSKGMKRRL